MGIPLGHCERPFSIAGSAGLKWTSNLEEFSGARHLSYWQYMQHPRLVCLAGPSLHQSSNFLVLGEFSFQFLPNAVCMTLSHFKFEIVSNVTGLGDSARPTICG